MGWDGTAGQQGWAPLPWSCLHVCRANIFIMSLWNLHANRGAARVGATLLTSAKRSNRYNDSLSTFCIGVHGVHEKGNQPENGRCEFEETFSLVPAPTTARVHRGDRLPR